MNSGISRVVTHAEDYYRINDVHKIALQTIMDNTIFIRELAVIIIDHCIFIKYLYQ